MKRQFFAVGWRSISDKNFPKPENKASTFAIFANENVAKRFAAEFGGLKVRPVEVSLKYARPTKRAADVKPRRAVKAKSRKASRG